MSATKTLLPIANTDNFATLAPPIFAISNIYLYQPIIYPREFSFERKFIALLDNPLAVTCIWWIVPP